MIQHFGDSMIPAQNVETTYFEVQIPADETWRIVSIQCLADVGMQGTARIKVNGQTRMAFATSTFNNTFIIDDEIPGGVILSGTVTREIVNINVMTLFMLVDRKKITTA